MPYADPEMKKKQMKRWRKHRMREGYGRWLYARRKLRFDNEERFRNALERVLEITKNDNFTEEEIILEATYVIETALTAARWAEEELGDFDSGSQI